MRGIASQDAQQQRLTLLINHEIASVECALRFNQKWTVVPRYYGEDDRMEPGKHDLEFRQLRHTITKLSDWPTIDPLIYLGPFLKLIKASDVSGPITGTAALAIQRILRSEFFSSKTPSAAEAINQIVEDATMCKFESTNNAQDEIVLLNIVQVLGIAVECDAGLLLTDEAVCKAFRASFMLGNPETKPKEYGDIMSYYSRQSCGHMLRTVFNRLRKQGISEAAAEDEVPCQHGLVAALEIMDFLIDLIKSKDAEGGQGQGSSTTARGEYAEDTILFALHMIHTALMTMGKELVYHDPLVAMVHVDLLHAMCQAVVNFTSVAIINAFSQIILSIYAFLGSVSVAQIEVVLERVLMKLAEGKGVYSAEQKEAALEGILDLCRQPGFIHDIFVNCDCRLERSNLFEDLCTLISKAAYPAGGSAKEGISSFHLVSLETLIAIFSAINADKKLEASTSTYGEEGNLLKPPSAPPPDLDLPCFVDVWTPMVKGEMFHLGPLIAAADAAASNSPLTGLTSHGSFDLSHDGQPSDYGKLRSAVHEKHMKQKLALAVDHFNRDFKKGFQFLQHSKLMPLQEGSPGALKAAAEAEAQGLPGPDVASEAELAACLGRYLRACPGLNKTSIGELLGEPADFYLKVLDAYTQSFDFVGVKFDAAIRLYLESFRLPGEAQKINRIINSFGHYYFIQNQGVFKNEDAAYVLAYSVIMLNTDRHNSQVKNKMTLESFRRNLRGCNDGVDFPVEFLDEIYHSIIKCALKLNESSSMDISEQAFLSLHQTSRTERGRMVYADAARQLFDSSMFQLMWGPAVHAMCGIVSSSSSSVLDTALDGLTTAAQIAMYYSLEDVVDTIVINLSKVPAQIAHTSGVRPDLVFGRDLRMKAVTQTLANISNRHGDCLMAGWSNVMELIVVFYRLQMLPDGFSKALNGDGEGGGLQIKKSPSDPEASLKARRAAAKAQANSGNTIFKSITSMLAIPAAEEGTDRQLTSEVDRLVASSSDETLTMCAFEDIFIDSKFLKQESLVHLVKAIVWASGSIPRSSGSGAANWDVSELCLELLFTVLLRNRDRIGLIWPKTYDYFHAIFANSKDIDKVLVQKSIMAMLRLCQRLLPYKTDISEPLLMGIQLVSLVDEQVAVEMAPTIASEVLNLLKTTAPYIQQQPVWASLFGLLKIIQFDPPSFPICVETTSWVVKEGLTPINFSVVLPLVVELVERAVPDMRKGVEPKPGFPQLLPSLLSLLLCAEEWLELWWATLSRGPQASDHIWLVFKQDAWVLVVTLLCRVIRNPNNEVRTTAVGYLQRCVVAAEKLCIAPEVVLLSLTKMVIPMTNDLSKLLTSVTKDFIHCDATVHELIRAIVKVVLLFADALPLLPSLGAAWRSILDCLSLAMANGASKSEVLAEAIPEALKNMLLSLQSKGILKEGWRDSDGTDLSDLTWKVCKRISPNLTPTSLMQ